jgi:hypothetical protein
VPQIEFGEDDEPTPTHAADAGPRPDAGPMDEEEMRALVSGILADAAKLIDTERSPDRALADKYYHGEKFGDEEEGRSQVVLTELRDAVGGVLPSFLRVVFGPEHVVELAPRTPEQVEQARVATEFLRYVFEEEEDGFLKTYAVAKDALVKRIGIYKWGWEAAQRQLFRSEKLTDAELEQLASDDAVELISVEDHAPASEDEKAHAPDCPCQAYAASAVPAGPPAGPAPAAASGATPTGSATPSTPAAPAPTCSCGASGTHTVEYARQEPGGRARIWAVPPEEFLYTREARGVNHALGIAHRTELSRSELLDLGITEEELEEHAQHTMSLRANAEEIERRSQTQASGIVMDPDAGKAAEKTLLTEAYLRLDWDGDGHTEVRRYRCLGDTFWVCGKPEPVDHIPFAVITPDPEPHAMEGLGLSDKTMDMQLVKSAIFRAQLDSLALSIFPRMGYVEGQVSYEDVANTAIGAPIRMRSVGALQPITHDFVGREASAVLAYTDEIVERRTGLNKGTMGLDADALQSTTRDGVEAATTSAQAQTELFVRVFCEAGLKPLFRGLYRLFVQHRPAARMVRLAGNWTEVNPAAWAADMDVSVRVALGSTLVEQKVAALLETKATQEAVLQMLGPSNPLVKLSQYYATLADLLALHGYKDATRYFTPVDPNWQPPEQAPQPSPEQVLAQAQLQVEQMKSERDFAIKQAEFAFKKQQSLLDHELKLKEMANDFVLRRYQIDAQFRADYSQQQQDADAAAQERALSGQMQAAELAHRVHMDRHGRALEMQQQDHQQSLDEEQAAHEQQIAERQAAAQEQAARSAGSEE